MRVSILFYVSCLALSACGLKKDHGELVNGYAVIAMNPKEIYVAKPDNELVVGPFVERIGMSDYLILVQCSAKQTTVNGFVATPGFSVVNTRSHLISVGLTDAEIHSMFREAGLPLPTMLNVSLYFDSKF